MSASPAPAAPNSSYSAVTLLGALAAILVTIGALIAASINVSEATAREQQYRVVAGNISVVGTAKVRQWQGSGFTLGVPAAWPLIADGLPENCTRETSSGCVAVHRWQGKATVGGEQEGGTCSQQAICVELLGHVPRPSERTGGADDVRAVWSRAFADQRASAPVQPRYLDYGGVTAKGGRWVYRAQSRVGGNLQTSYVFATCQAGRLGKKAKAERYWELRLSAPADAIPTFQFYDLIASLETELASPRRGQDCSFSV